MTKPAEEKVSWTRKLRLEATQYLLNVLYLTILFAVFMSYRRLVLADYNISYSDWGISFIKAVVLAKVILLASQIHVGRRLESKPLILPTIFLSVLFTFWMALFALVESAILGFLHGKGVSGALDHLFEGGMDEFFSKCLVVFVAFIPFFAFRELGRVLGKGIMWDLFFGKGPVADRTLVDRRTAS